MEITGETGTYKEVDPTEEGFPRSKIHETFKGGSTLSVVKKVWPASFPHMFQSSACAPELRLNSITAVMIKIVVILLIILSSLFFTTNSFSFNHVFPSVLFLSKHDPRIPCIAMEAPN